MKLVSQKRIGHVPDDNRKRPILAILEDREARDNILQKAKILKEKGEVYNIRLKWQDLKILWQRIGKLK